MYYTSYIYWLRRTYYQYYTRILIVPIIIHCPVITGLPRNVIFLLLNSPSTHAPVLQGACAYPSRLTSSVYITLIAFTIVAYTTTALLSAPLIYRMILSIDVYIVCSYFRSYRSLLPPIWPTISTTIFPVYNQLCIFAVFGLHTTFLSLLIVRWFIYTFY